MKKNLLSIALACVIITMTFAAPVPVLATVDYDTVAAAQGYVARIGDAEAAYDGGSFSGYYKFLDSTYSGQKAALTDAKNSDTVTLIADADMRAADGNLTVGVNNLTIEAAEGKNVTVYRRGSFIADGKTLTFKNVNIFLEKDGASIFNIKGGGTLNLINCCFRYTGTLKYGLFQAQGANINVTGGRVDLGEYNTDTGTYGGIGVSDTSSVKTAIFWSSTESSSLNLNGFEADISSSPEVYGVSFEKGGDVSMTDTSLTTADHTMLISGAKAVDINICGASRIVSRSGDAVRFSGISSQKAASISISDTASLVGGLHGINCGNGRYALSVDMYDSASVKGEQGGIIALSVNGGVAVEMSGTSYLKGGIMALEIDKCIGDVRVKLNGSSRIESDNDCVFICGDDGKLELELNGRSSISGVGYGVDVGDADNALHPVSISMKDEAFVSSQTAISIGSTRVSLDVRGNSALNAQIPYSIAPSNVSSTVTVDATAGLSTVAPTVEYGASIRISDGANGIRFCTTVKADRVANAKDYGILLVKHGELVTANADFTAYSMDSKNVTYTKISALDDNGSGISENGDGMLSFNIVLTDLPDDQLTTRFAIRAYAVYNVNGTDVYVYSDFSEDANVRSMANVAYCALRDLKQEKDAANGYIYEIDTRKWSCYTKEQYDIISLTYGDIAEPMVNA